MDVNLQSFEEDSKLLESIARELPADSAEQIALRRAGYALFYVATRHSRDFQAFIVDCERDLSPEERANLKKLGLGD
jgi:hypothetical protein